MHPCLFFEQEVLERVGNYPSTSTRAIVHAMSSNQSSVLRVLQEQILNAYHLQKVAYKDWGPTTSHLVFDLPSGFCNRASWILPFLHWWGLLQQQKQPQRREYARSVRQSSPDEIEHKPLGWNSWRLSAGTCHHSRPFEWCSLTGIPTEHASGAHEGDTPRDTQRNVVPIWWRSSTLQPASTSTSEQSTGRNE